MNEMAAESGGLYRRFLLSSQAKVPTQNPHAANITKVKL
jgi:hypothetical protein